MSAATATFTSAGADTDGLFGHPKGLFNPAFTKAWERFSFYGMMALPVLS
jgi:dipeptide/tripeptide permease